MERLILTNTTDVERFFRQQKTAWQEWGTGFNSPKLGTTLSKTQERGRWAYWGQRGGQMKRKPLLAANHMTTLKCAWFYVCDQMYVINTNFYSFQNEGLLNLSKN